MKALQDRRGVNSYIKTRTKKDEDDSQDEWSGGDSYDDNDYDNNDFEENGFDENEGFGEDNLNENNGQESGNNDNVEIDKEDIKDTLSDIVDEDSLKKDLNNQPAEDQNDLVKQYLEEVQNETNENDKDEEKDKDNKEDKEPNVKESFKIAKKSE